MCSDDDVHVVTRCIDRNLCLHFRSLKKNFFFSLCARRGILRLFDFPAGVLDYVRVVSFRTTIDQIYTEKTQHLVGGNSCWFTEPK